MNYGLIGFPLNNSFSENYFRDLFNRLALTNHKYNNYAFSDLNSIKVTISENKLHGFNVTLPYKTAIIPFLDKLDTQALQAGAVNCVEVNWHGDRFELNGYNTDVFGFQKSLLPLLKPWHLHALILGDGGASKAVEVALKNLGITYHIVSRKNDSLIAWEQVDKACIRAHQVIINCTPLGMYPNVLDAVPIPYDYITDKHLVYDLIYLPEQTAFLVNAAAKGATVKNGLEMLHLQAQKSWEIWNEK